jgi:hypothetical protein
MAVGFPVRLGFWGVLAGIIKRLAGIVARMAILATGRSAIFGVTSHAVYVVGAL